MFQKLHILPSIASLPPLVSLEGDLKRLNQKKGLSDYERWDQYRNIFQTYFAYKRRHDGSAPIASSSSPGPVPMKGVPDPVREMVRKALPTYMKPKGENVLHFLAQPHVFRDVGVNDKGELLIHGQVISQTNIVDLILYAVRGTKTKTAPTGWPVFYDMLKKSNIPYEFLAPLHRPAAKKEEEEDEESFEDPSALWSPYP